jgi:hypothetical protein
VARASSERQIGSEAGDTPSHVGARIRRVAARIVDRHRHRLALVQRCQVTAEALISTSPSSGRTLEPWRKTIST